MLVKTAWLSLALLLAEHSMRLKTGETGAEGRVEGVGGPGDIIAPSPSLSPNTTNLPWLTTNARKGGRFRLPGIKRPLFRTAFTLAGLSDRGASFAFRIFNQTRHASSRLSHVILCFRFEILYIGIAELHWIALEISVRAEGMLDERWDILRYW